MIKNHLPESNKKERIKRKGNLTSTQASRPQMDGKIHCTHQPYGEGPANAKITVLQTEKL